METKPCKVFAKHEKSEKSSEVLHFAWPEHVTGRGGSRILVRGASGVLTPQGKA